MKNITHDFDVLIKSFVVYIIMYIICIIHITVLYIKNIVYITTLYI